MLFMVDLWFVVEWDEEGTYSEVKSKWILDCASGDPSEGDHVKVKCGKKVFRGCIIKKGG